MSTPWVPSHPRSREWRVAARVGESILIGDGDCLIRVQAPINPDDRTHIARIIGHGPATIVTQTGGWDRNRPDRTPEESQNLLRQVWVDSEASTTRLRVAVTPSPWCKWITDQGEQKQVRLFRVGDTTIAIDTAMISLFIAVKMPFEKLRFWQRKDELFTAVQVWTGSTPRGLVMPMPPNIALLDGLQELIGGAE